MARQRTKHEAVASAADSSPKSLPQPGPVDASDVARRAYALYLARGREDGHDVDDWMQAERELRDTVRSDSRNAAARVALLDTALERRQIDETKAQELISDVADGGPVRVR